MCGAGQYSNVKGEHARIVPKVDIVSMTRMMKIATRQHAMIALKDTIKTQLARRRVPCLPGEFGNETGLIQCHKCSVGMFRASSQVNSTHCSNCPKDTFRRTRVKFHACLPASLAMKPVS